MDKVRDIQNIDIKEQYNTLIDIFFNFLNSYKEKTTWKLRVIDSFIIFNFFLLGIQILYALLVGFFPKNSFISGLVCCIGSITLTGKIKNNIHSFIKNAIESSLKNR